MSPLAILLALRRRVTVITVVFSFLFVIGFIVQAVNYNGVTGIRERQTPMSVAKAWMDSIAVRDSVMLEEVRAIRRAMLETEHYYPGP